MIDRRKSDRNLHPSATARKALAALMREIEEAGKRAAEGKS
jgi:hypothetical protein